MKINSLLLLPFAPLLLWVLARLLRGFYSDAKKDYKQGKLWALLLLCWSCTATAQNTDTLRSPNYIERGKVIFTPSVLIVAPSQFTLQTNKRRDTMQITHKRGDKLHLRNGAHIIPVYTSKGVLVGVHRRRKYYSASRLQK